MFRGIFAVLFLSLSGLVACSPSPDVIPIDSPLKPVNVEACRHTSLSLKNFNATSVRGLVTCLNGDNGALQPFKDFLDAMDTSDLNQLLEIYNKHIYGTDDRLNETLDLLDEMHKLGYLKTFMTDLHLLTQYQVAQKFLPVLSRVFESELQPGTVDPSLKRLSGLFVRLIDDGQVDPQILMASHAFNGLHAHVLSLLISQANSHGILNSDGVVDLVSNEIVSSIEDGSFHEFFTHLSDPSLNLPSLLSTLSEGQLSALSDFINYVSGAVNGDSKLEAIRQLVLAADGPLICFKNGNRARMSPNIFEFVARQVVGHADGENLNRFFMKDLPLLVSATEDGCRYPQDVINNISIEEDIARQGFAVGHKVLFNMMLNSGRFEEITHFFESPHISRLSPLMEDMGIRGEMPMFLQLLARDLNGVDAQTMSDLLDYIVTGDLQGSRLSGWLSSSLSSTSRDVLMADLKNMPARRRSLIYLSLYAAADRSHGKALYDLKQAVAQSPFSDSFEMPMISMAKKMFKDEAARRKELKDLARAIVVSLGDSRGGLGDMLTVMTKAAYLSPLNPFQKILHDTMADQALVDKIVPILWKVSRDPQFGKVVAFTGQLAGNGQLEKLITFMAELLRSSDRPGLNPVVPASSGPRLSTNVIQFLAAHHQRTVPQPPGVDYGSCADLSGSLFARDGHNITQALQCLNSDGDFPGLARAGGHLEAAGLLPQAADLLGTMASTSPYLNGALDELQTLSQSGQLHSLLQLYWLASQSPYDLTTGVDGLLSDAFDNPGMPGTLKLLGKISRLPELNTAGIAALKVLNNQPVKTFFSDNNFRIRLRDPEGIKAEIHKLFPKDSDEQVDEIFTEARENFETHNDVWKYEEGPYPRLTDQEWKDTIIEFLEDLLRTTDLQEFVAALQDVARNMDTVRFLKDALDQQYVVARYTDDGQMKVHIVSLLEQLEELVLDGDFNVPVTGHVGVHFQLAVVHANDLPLAMRQQEALTELGLRWAQTFRKKVPINRFKSMLANYDGLLRIADDGDLRIFQRIYRGLYNATPVKYREKADSVHNHMSMAFLVNKVGLFQTLTMALSNARAQGKLEQIVNGLMGVTLLIDQKDIEPLRQAITALVTSAKQGDMIPVEILLNKLLTIQQNPQGYQELKDTLFQLVPAVARLSLEPTGLLKSIPILVSRPRVWNDLLDKFLSDSTSPQGDVFTTAANLSQVDEPSMKAFRHIGAVVLSDDPQTGEAYLPSLVQMAVDGYAARPDECSRLWGRYQAFKNDPRVVALQPTVLFTGVLSGLQGQSGLGDELGSVLLDQRQRRELIQMGSTLAKNGDIAEISRVLADLIANGDVEWALNFVFDNLTSTSVGSN